MAVCVCGCVCVCVCVCAVRAKTEWPSVCCGLPDWVAECVLCVRWQAGWLCALGAEEGQVSLHNLVLGTQGPADPAQLDALLAGCSSVFFCAGFEKQEPATISFMTKNTARLTCSVSAPSVRVASPESDTLAVWHGCNAYLPNLNMGARQHPAGSNSN